MASRIAQRAAQSQIRIARKQAEPRTSGGNRIARSRAAARFAKRVAGSMGH